MIISLHYVNLFKDIFYYVMITLIFGAVILLLCLIAPVALHLYQRHQNARLAQMRRAAQLTHAYRLTQRFLHRIPPQYLTRECRLLLLDRSIAFLVKLKKETHENQLISSKMFRNQAVLDELNTNFVSPPPVTLKTALEAREAQGNLTDLSRFIEIQARSAAIPRSIADDVIPQVNWLAVKCITDFNRDQGNLASVKKDYRLAVYHYTNAINEFNKHLEFETAEQGLQECQKNVDKNRQLLEQQESGVLDQEEESSLLMQEWDALNEEGEDLKKQLYQ
jgi:hypothetical protein